MTRRKRREVSPLVKRRSLIAGDQPGTADPYTRLCLRSDPVKITRGFSRSTFKDVNQYDGVRSERCARPFISPTTGDTGRVSGYIMQSRGYEYVAV